MSDTTCTGSTSRPRLRLHRDREAAAAGRLLVVHLDPIDAGAARAQAAPVDERLDLAVGPLEERLHRAVGAVPDPAGDVAGFGPARERVAKADALDVAGHDHALAGHLLP